jgi:hypothetical protein
LFSVETSVLCGRTPELMTAEDQSAPEGLQWEGAECAARSTVIPGTDATVQRPRKSARRSRRQRLEESEDFAPLVGKRGNPQAVDKQASTCGRLRINGHGALWKSAGVAGR